MSSYGTIVQSGKFTSAGTNKTLQLRGDVDWMWVYNYTQAATQQATGRGVQFYWQRGMSSGTGIEYKKTNSTDALNMVTLSSGGFTLVDTSLSPLGALNNGSTGISAISNASIPVATVGSTAGMAAGSVVRIYNTTNAQQLGGIDFTVGYNTFSSTTFSLDYMSQLAVAGTTGSFRVVNWDPLFYPRRRFITKISKASSAVVTLSVTHQFTVGQEVRFVVPAAYGMVEMDGLLGTITAIDTTTTSGNTVTVNIDSSAFTTFAFPATGAVPFSPAELVPVGEDTAQALSSAVDILGDATINTGYIGMILAAGAQSPAGSSSDVIFWVAGKSWSVDNQ